MTFYNRLCSCAVGLGVALNLGILSSGATKAQTDSGTAQIPCHQYYPNIEGKVLLENEKVVVQRFTFPPGVWEGVHAHPPDQIYIQLNAGEWTVRYGDRITRGWSEKGSAGFYGPVPLEEDHESMNSGDEPIDLVWVTLKGRCSEAD